jgi:hypothetical protein
VTEKVTDQLDVAAALTEHERDTNVAAIRKAAENIAVGEAGECAQCGEFSLRLVHKCCAACRDKYKLP